MLTKLALAALTAVVAAAIACGGGGGGGGGSDEQQAQAAAERAVLTLLGMFNGTTSGKDVIAVFAPECREGVKASDIDGALALIRAFVPNLPKDKVEELDLGKVSFNKTSDGIEVTPDDTTAARLKVKGKWLTVEDYFSSAGLDSSDASSGVSEPLLMVKRDGKWFVGDCSTLKDFSSPLGGLTDTTPAATARPGGSGTTVPTSSPNAVGRSRANPITFGQAGQVESTWELSVLSVDRDAWSLVQQASRFNDPPAANEKMVLLKLRAKNITSKQSPENIDTFSIKLVGSRNQLYDSFSSKTSCGSIPDELDANLFPAGQVDGHVCFKVPADETGFQLVWSGFLSSDLTYFALE